MELWVTAILRRIPSRFPLSETTFDRADDRMITNLLGRLSETYGENNVIDYVESGG